MIRIAAFTILLLGLALSCGPASGPGAARQGSAEGAGSGGEALPASGSEVAWAIAIHGGAGTIDRDTDPARLRDYEGSLERALGLGRSILERGGTSLDAVEAVVRRMEDDPLFNAGRGAVFNAPGKHELDASIMSGRDLAAGAVAGVARVRHPITAARRVMEETPHVLLAGPGADRFAEEQELEIVENAYFATERRREAWRRARRNDRLEEPDPPRGTVGAVALDRFGHLAAATSTGGLTNKMIGRVGDTPIVGAGTYADDDGAAVSCTGVGEQFIRHGVAHSVSLLVSRDGASLDAAARTLLEKTLDPGDGGLIAMDRAGNAVLLFTTQAMPRAAADAGGRFETMIW